MANKYKVPFLGEYAEGHEKVCEKIFFDKNLLFINYYGFFFLMRRDGLPINPLTIGRIFNGTMIDFDKWRFCLRRFKNDNCASSLSRKERKLADKALLIIGNDPFYYSLSKKQKEVQLAKDEAKKRMRIDLDNRWATIELRYASFDPVLITSINLGAYYLSDRERTYKLLEDYWEANMRHGNLSPDELQNAEKFLKDLHEDNEEAAEAEHMAM